MSKTIATTIRIPAPIHAAAVRDAESQGVALADWLRDAVSKKTDDRREADRLAALEQRLMRELADIKKELAATEIVD